MTKYLRQVATIENAILDGNGKPVLNVYGQPQFGLPVQSKCRKEAYKARANTSYGQFVNFTTTYYFDETVTIRNGDKVDGQEVQSIEEYVDGVGILIGYRVDV